MKSCGLDFGTSNSAIGTMRDGQAVLAPMEDGSSLLPSAIFFDTGDLRRARFGNAAIQSYMNGEDGRLMRALKSTLASPLIDQATSIGRLRIRLREIIEVFIREMKQRAESFIGEEITSVVHGRPVHFAGGDDAADARAQSILEDLAHYAGFKHVAFEYEPIAAALHYEATATREEIILVADIGGGTSDFSVVRIGPHRRNHPDRRSDILANAGARIGGTNFNSALSLEAAMPMLGLGTETIEKSLVMPKAIYHELSNWPTINFLYTYGTERDVRELLADAKDPEKVARLLKTIRKRLGHRIAFAVEEAKLVLSDEEYAAINLGFIEDQLMAPATRGGFDAAIAERTERLANVARSCIKDAGLRANEIETIFYTGGSSRVPAVQRAVALAAPSAEIATRSDFLSVALGLTLRAAQLFA